MLLVFPELLIPKEGKQNLNAKNCMIDSFPRNLCVGIIFFQFYHFFLKIRHIGGRVLLQ